MNRHQHLESILSPSPHRRVRPNRRRTVADPELRAYAVAVAILAAVVTLEALATYFWK